MPSPRSRLVLIGAAGVLLATGLGALAVQVTPQPAAVAAPPATTAPAPAPVPTPPLPATELTASGVRAAWVVKENDLPGSPDWRITHAPATGLIEGFADQTYATTGQPVRLFVSTSARTFHVEAFRIGYYGGAGGRLVWESPDLPGGVQAKCPLIGGINMVSCANWKPSLTMHVTEAFPPGDYLLKLVGAGDEQGYVPLTVWDPASHATYLVKNDVFTWQAWNPYGGFDYYQGVGTCPPGVYPLCTRARVVSFDRPYADGRGAGNFPTLEAPLVRLLEREGLDVDYVNDMVVQDHPGVLSGHSALLSLGHDECWSLGERTAVQQANAKGLNVAFFGASAVLRHVRTQPSPLGDDRELVDYRDSAADPLNGKGEPKQVTGNTWGSPPASWPEDGFVGESYNGFLEPGVHANLAVADPSAWIFKDTGLGRGATVPAVIASDVDSLEPVAAHPPDVQVLAHSPLPVRQAQAATRKGPVFYSDMTYYTDPASKAGVWDSGTNNWIPALDAGCQGADCPATAMTAMTTNLLFLFGQGPSGRQIPSRPNWRTFYPPG
ncbi:MAG TPA: N,N-dimethylformamidase beta subunit family domain-containing protein [Pseudonocardiaceae bacterium]|nr:N,N-dimethylformamidase beta subunit family domain-containing protein [Pseudonocardiaceae bacterium]